MAAEPTGFAGFESLVTDLSDLPALPAQWNAAGAPPATRPRAAKRSTSFPVWILVCIALSVLGRLATLGNNGQPSVTSHDPVPVTASQLSPVTVWPATLNPVPASQPASPAAAAEEKPPAGQGVLSEPQVRYCMSQGIRIQGAEKAVSADSRDEVMRFLSLVDDYNPRCSSSRFGLGAQSVKAYVEAQRAALELEGAALIRLPAEQAKPPVAAAASPSGSQERNCVAQRIRIQEAEKAVNLLSKADVKRFQALLDDYKRRCGDDRVAAGVKQSLKEQSLKEEMEALRATLMREGVIRPPAGPR